MVSAVVLQGDCLALMADMEPNSIDACVTDPPYHLTSIVKRFGSADASPAKAGATGAYARASRGFMGKTWDGGGVAFDPATWAAVLRVLKPGAHLLAFGGSRTYHRLACAIEDAGFEVRDQIMWLYGSGFPKSHNLDGEWTGWGTALKPAHEPIVVARKPLVGSVAANVLRHGTGALNVDDCRVETSGRPLRELTGERWHGSNIECRGSRAVGSTDLGRWPANVMHDGSDEVAALFPHGQAGTAVRHRSGGKNCHSDAPKPPLNDMGYGDTGSAARFFYCAKASKADRDEGLDAFAKSAAGMVSETSGQHLTRREPDAPVPMRANTHPTVKPTDLMRYLCRLITPPGGTILDPFTGSGSTGKAAVLEGFSFVGCELTEEYVPIARARIAAAEAEVAARHPDLFAA